MMKDKLNNPRVSRMMLLTGFFTAAIFTPLLLSNVINNFETFGTLGDLVLRVFFLMSLPIFVTVGTLVVYGFHRWRPRIPEFSPRIAHFPNHPRVILPPTRTWEHRGLALLGLGTTLAWIIPFLAMVGTTSSESASSDPLISGVGSFLMMLLFGPLIFGIWISCFVFALVMVNSEVKWRRTEKQYIRELLEFEAVAPEVIARYQPVYAFFANPGPTFAPVYSWLPYLEKIGLPFILMTSDTDNFEKLQSTYTIPTVLVGNSTIWDWTPSSVITIVYSMLRSANDTPLRVLGDRGHIYIGHGPSDKVASAHRLYRSYDRFCVPGQAGADLFEFNRIGVRPHFLELVGRPQVSELQVRAVTDGDHKVKTVLYAPTWSGLHVDDQNSSITRGVLIVRALAARGYTVIFRPHPLSLVKNPLSSKIDDRPWVEPVDQFLRANHSGTGQVHMTSDVTGRMSFAECANMSDALIGDISSVVVDYLVTNKPIGLNSNYDNLRDFYRAKPFARSVYAIERDLSNLDTVLDSFVSDPTQSKRKKLQKLYLGDRTPEQQVDYFVEKMRGLILRGRELGVD